MLRALFVLVVYGTMCFCMLVLAYPGRSVWDWHGCLARCNVCVVVVMVFAAAAEAAAAVVVPVKFPVRRLPWTLPTVAVVQGWRG